MSGLSRFSNKVRQFVSPTAQLPAVTEPTAVAVKTLSPEEQTARLAKRPDIYILRLLMSNGPMTSTQIWRTYQRQLKESQTERRTFEEFFASKAQLKQKCLKVMRESERIESNGYNHRTKEHLGWRVNPDKAFRNLRGPAKELLRSLEKK
jgi:hypothetical protein